METRGLIRRIAKADFADVLGVALRGDVVAVAHVRKRFDAVRVLEVASHRLAGPAEARVTEAAAFLRSFTQGAELEPSRVAVVLDRAATSLASVALPSAAAANVQDAVRFELDRLFPFSPESLRWACTKRQMGTLGERIGVTVFAAPAAAVDEAAAIVREAGLPISTVTVEPAVLADYLALVGLPLAAVATRSGDREYLTLCAAGLAVSSRPLDRRPRPLAESVQREMEAALPERSGDVPALLRERVQEPGELALPAVAPAGLFPEEGRVGEPEVLAVGAALGLVGESAQPVNLLPAAMVQTAAGFGLRELALSGAVALSGLVLLATIGARNLAIHGALASQVEELEPRVEQALRREEKNAQLLATVEKLDSHSRSRVLQYLKAVTELVPQSSYLTTFRYREDKIEVEGISDKASELIAILESSPYFTGVEFTAPTTKYLSNQERFSLRMRLEQ